MYIKFKITVWKNMYTWTSTTLGMVTGISLHTWTVDCVRYWPSPITGARSVRICFVVWKHRINWTITRHFFRSISRWNSLDKRYSVFTCLLAVIIIHLHSVYSPACSSWSYSKCDAFWLILVKSKSVVLCFVCCLDRWCVVCYVVHRRKII